MARTSGCMLKNGPQSTKGPSSEAKSSGMKKDRTQANTSPKEVHKAQIAFLDAASQVLADQMWNVMVIGGMSITREPQDQAGVHHLRVRFVGVKLEKANSAVSILPDTIGRPKAGGKRNSIRR